MLPFRARRLLYDARSAGSESNLGNHAVATGAYVTRVLMLVVLVFGVLGVGARGQTNGASELDRLLDLYVRDGFVYYAALKTERATLGRVVRAISDVPSDFSAWSTDSAKAFWLNAYNALVLQTVVDQYPIRGSAPEYPRNSIRQIAGAFDQRSHSVAGQELTLDAIESEVLRTFDDPRLFLALGRGAVGSGRLRSEVYTASRVEEQLEAVVKEYATLPQYVALDRLAEEVRVSAVFGWRSSEFVAAFGDRGWSDSGRAPIERAILTMIEPALFPSERAYLEANEFSLRYQDFDWRLNDLTGGRP